MHLLSGQIPLSIVDFLLCSPTGFDFFLFNRNPLFCLSPLATV